MDRSARADEIRARSYLRGEWHGEPAEILQLAKALARRRSFRYARKILGRVREGVLRNSPLYTSLAQQHALCTYRDAGLPTRQRLELARKILEEADDLASTNDPETLGIAGAIEKRLWQVEGQPHHLERALAFYLRGYALGVSADAGYTAINAAYMLDLLADLERRNGAVAGVVPETAKLRAARAEAIRREIVDVLPAAELDDRPETERWWLWATVAEAYFGLGDFAQAGEWLRRAAAIEGVPGWYRETTARQLASLAVLRKGTDVLAPDSTSGALGVIEILIGDHRAAIESMLLGKVGLALSGGGFRASFFHLGVLARLAELDVLRNVEVLSCVSGGAIVGTHYYLELKRLLESKPDAEITRQDYIDLVARVAESFLAGVQRNVRMRVLAELTTNLKMLLWPNYSRTLRVGELYEREIYSRVADGKGAASRYMDELILAPAGEEADFDPTRDNWRRRARVPVLVLNATALNTGHSWHFTASWMGEPPGDIDTDIDGNERLRRMYYTEAPPGYRRVRLGHAVAASSCVPGLFEPIEFAGLYPGRVLRLVDGGVHDNQGVATLLDHDCRTLLVSDASGQMATQANPSAGPVGVLLRSNDILMARVREEQHDDLGSRERAGQLQGCVFLHLKRGIPVEPVDWVGCAEPYDVFGDPWELAQHPEMLPYGIPLEAQKRLAGIRTDLDSFSDAEAYALMLSGYRMMRHDFPRCLPDYPSDDPPTVDWSFLRIDQALRKVNDPESQLRPILDVASRRALKIWRLNPYLRAGGILLATAGMAAIATIALHSAASLAIPLQGVIMAVGVVVLVLLFGQALRLSPRVSRYRKAVSQVGIGMMMGLGGWLVARVHLHLFDPLYLWWGSADRICEPGDSRPWFAFPAGGLRRRPLGSAADGRAAEVATGAGSSRGNPRGRRTSSA